MTDIDYGVIRSQDTILATNKVLRNTYWLLSLTLIFSAVTAGISTLLEIPRGLALILMLVAFGMMFWVNRVADSKQGLVAVFAFTGLLGFALGPTLNYYLALANGPALIMQSLGGTALTFLALSGYVLTSRRDFSYMGGFLFTGVWVLFAALLLNLFLDIPVLSLALSAAVILLMSGLILFDTSRIIHGGETNYIRATVGLYLSIYNIFLHLLHLLGAVGED